MPGACRGHLDLRRPRGPGAEPHRRDAGQTQDLGQRQRHGVDLERDPRLGAGHKRGLALHRTRKANAERLYREFQRPAPGRVLERDLIPVFAASPDGFGKLAGRLQQPAAALAAELVDATSLRSIAKGFCAEPVGKLHAKPLCVHRPTGQYEPPSSPHRWIKVGGRVIGGRGNPGLCDASGPGRSLGRGFRGRMAARRPLASVSVLFLFRVQQRNRPDPVPVTLLGQLAVDRHDQGQGHARSLLLFALRTALEASALIGSTGVITHPLGDSVRAFYGRWGLRGSRRRRSREACCRWRG